MNVPIVVVAYNRFSSLRRILNSLLKADISEAPLIISIDKSDTDKVEQYAESFNWPYGEKKVIKHNQNLGLRRHILSIGKLFDEYDAIIVLEDDIVVSPAFYKFATAAADFYQNDENIAGISLYNYEFNYQTFQPFNALHSGYDVYFMQIAMSWGQVWMKKSWLTFWKWYNENKDFKLSNIDNVYCFKDWGEKSWLKYHIAYCIDQNKFFVYPYTSYSTNCSDKGAHIKSELFVFHSSLKWCSAENEFKFPHFPQGVVYDSYNENTAIYGHLGIDKNDLTLDLADNNKKHTDKRFLLTTKQLDYKIEKGYSVDFRPIELNILMNNWGDGIYLYDTHYKAEKPQSFATISLICYKYRIHSLLAILKKAGCKALMQIVLKKIVKI